MTGCGTSSDSAGDTRSDIEAAVREGMTKNDPAWCETSATTRFLEQMAGDVHGDPAQICRLNNALATDTQAHEVKFRSVEPHGDRAVVTALLVGGDGDGSFIRLELIRSGDRWKFDRLADIQIDRTRFDAAARNSFLQLGASKREAACAVDRLRRIYDTDQLEHAFLQGETDGYDAAEAICLSRATLVRLIGLVLRKAVPKDVSPSIVDCVSRRVSHSMSTGQLRAVFGAGNELNGYLRELIAAAAEQCVQESESGLAPEQSQA